MNAYINSQGSPRESMISVFIGTIVSLILNTLFILILDMGVTGAAYANVIAQLFSMCWSVKFLLSDRSKIRLKMNLIRFDWKLIMHIASLGSAQF